MPHDALGGLKEEAMRKAEMVFGHEVGKSPTVIDVDDWLRFIDSLLDRAVKVERLRAFEILSEEFLALTRANKTTLEVMDALERAQKAILSADNR